MHIPTLTLKALLSAVAASIVLVAAPAAADPLMFDFTGSQGGSFGSGSFGNVRTFSDGGVTVTATGWGYTQGRNDTAFQTGALGRWDTGMGVCNRDEGGSSCGSPEHQVDNVGSDDWVLFVFSTAVEIDSVRIDPYGNRDRDVSYYAGNVSTPLSLAGESYSDLTGPGGLGFDARRSDTSSSSGSARNVSIGGGYVNALLFGGYFGGSDQDDYFKIASISAHTREVAPPPPPPPPVPEPATLLLTGAGISAMIARRKLRKQSS